MIIKKTDNLLSAKKKKQKVITEAQRKQYQHELSNWIKKYGKKVLEKGPEMVDVSLTGNLIVLTITNYLSKYEKFIIETDSSGIKSLKESRLNADLAIIRSGELDRHIEEVLNVEVTGHMFDALLEDEFSLWIILLDTSFITQI